LVLCPLEIAHRDDLLAVPRGIERRLVDKICQIGSRKPGRSARDYRDIDVLSKRNLSRMDDKNTLAAPDVRTIDDHSSIEAARTQQRRVEDVGAVGRSDQDYTVVRLEAVHFDKQLV